MYLHLWQKGARSPVTPPLWTRRHVTVGLLSKDWPKPVR